MASFALGLQKDPGGQLHKLLGTALVRHSLRKIYYL